MRTRVILNPTAGGRARAGDLGRRIEQRFRGEVVTTCAPGDAIELAREAARSGYDRVIAVGGDGTVRDVAAGLYLGGGTARLGIIPAGTGNDLAYSLGLPSDIEEAGSVATGGRLVSLDLIRAAAPGSQPEVRLLANAAVAGFCGRIADAMWPVLRRRLRPVAYPVSALSQLADLRRYRVHIDTGDRAIDTRAFMVIVANGEYAGGRLRLAPGARFDDGRLDVVVLHSAGLARLVSLVPSVLRGRHAGRPDVSIHRAESVRLESEPPMWINLDGDTWRAGSATFEAIPSALRVAVP